MTRAQRHGAGDVEARPRARRAWPVRPRARRDLPGPLARACRQGPPRDRWVERRLAIRPDRTSLSVSNNLPDEKVELLVSLWVV